MKLMVFHFRPIEAYPPIQNLLSFLEKEGRINEVFCLSNRGLKNYLTGSNKIHVIKVGSLNSKLGVWVSYVLYSLVGLFYLFVKKPKYIIYYETLSSFPVYLYTKVFRRPSKVLIHYHEYLTKEDWSITSPVEQFFHKKEHALYKDCFYLSQTNSARLQKFLQDEKIEYRPKIHGELPNYPSEKFYAKNEFDNSQDLKLVFVGYSVNAEDSYFIELINWLAKQNRNIELDIYCLLPPDEPEKTSEKIGQLNINYKNPIPYSELNKVLPYYQIGLILYRGRTENFVFNAPNKLFEYLACGLDVWYPKEMAGIKEYASQLNPKVIELDFKELDSYSLDELTANSNDQRTINFTSENVYGEYINRIFEDENFTVR